MFLTKFSSMKSPWTKWCVFFLWMLLCLDVMARAETDMWAQRIVLMEFLKLNHPYNHRVSLLDHNVCCSVTKSCPTVFTLMDYSTPGFPVLHNLPSLLRLMSIESVMPSNHLILCCHLLLLPSIFPSIIVFSNESALCIRWPKYRSIWEGIKNHVNCHPTWEGKERTVPENKKTPQKQPRLYICGSKRRSSLRKIIKLVRHIWLESE